MVTLIIPISIISIAFILLWFAKRFGLDKKYLNSTKHLLYFLIGWTFFGFLIQEDFTEDCGCLVHSRSTFSIDYILFSFISLFMFILAAKSKTTRQQSIFLCTELTYWLLKLFVLKSGYLGGLGFPIFSTYDFIGLSARFWLLSLLFNLRIRQLFILIIAGTIISLKMLYFPCQENFVYEKWVGPMYEKSVIEK